MKIMEVCGTHTVAISQNGLKNYFSDEIEFLSGPGCPVCVTSEEDLFLAISLAQNDQNIIATFGDMLKVPAYSDSLQNYRNVKIVYSPFEALNIAEKFNKEVIFLGIGFETTSPLTAYTIKEAKKRNLKNFSVLSFHKTMPEVLKLVCKKKHDLKNFILPGHVAAITGKNYFNFLLDYSASGVVAGFDGKNLIDSVNILKNIKENKIINNYIEVVNDFGNLKALNLVNDVFEPFAANWRGIGALENSGLKIRSEYRDFSSFDKFKLTFKKDQINTLCSCGDVLMGDINPKDCPLFFIECTPSNPIGPCMISSEGACAACFKYER